MLGRSVLSIVASIKAVLARTTFCSLDIDVLFVVRRGLAQRLLYRRRDVVLKADVEVLSERLVDAYTRVGLSEAVDDAVHGATLGHAAANRALDAVLRHEVERARRAALDWLPALQRVYR